MIEIGDSMVTKIKRPKKQQIGIPRQISGMAGVYHVACELSRRGYIALPTNRNVAGFDIVVSNRKGLKQAILEVKTLQKKADFWLINRPVPDYMESSTRAFYVFVRFDEKQDKFECFIASAKDVAKQIKGYVKDWYKKHSKKTKPSNWTYSWYLPKEKESYYLNRWNKLRLD